MRNLWIVLGLVLMLPQVVLASSIAQMTVGELQTQADLIILGTVTHIEHEDVRDHVTIKVGSYLEGSDAPQETYQFTLTTRGGLKDFDPDLSVGDTGVFFLKKKEDGSVAKAYWGSVAIFPNQIYKTE